MRILSLLILFSSSAFADSGKKGIIVINSAEPKAVVTNQSVAVHGTIKEVHHKQATLQLAEDMDAQKIEIKTFFPDYTTEVTAQTQFNADKNIYDFNSAALTEGLTYQMITTVGRVPTEARSMLALKSKFEQRFAILDQKITALLTQGKTEQELKKLIKHRDNYGKLILKIEAHLARKYKDYTESRFAIQFNNEKTLESSSTTTSTNFKLKLSATPGNIIQGTSFHVDAQVSFYGEVKDPIFDVEFWVDGSKLSEQNHLNFITSPELTHSFDVVAGSSVNLAIKVFQKERHKRDLVAYLPFSPSVHQDTTGPTIQLTSTLPNHPVTALISDSFGFVDPASISVKLIGTTTQDLTSQFTMTKIGDGQSYSLSGALPTLDEGQYTFKISAKDTAGNSASPLEQTFSIDRTAPVIQLGVQDSLVTTNPSLTLPVTITDASPTITSIFFNGVKIVDASPNLSFSPVLTLTEGVNQVEVTSKDSFGNTSTAKLLSLTLNTAPIGLSYGTNPATYLKGITIENNHPSLSGGGAPTSYSISPTLPAGLEFSVMTGIISGTPTVTSLSKEYTITASNNGGSTTAYVNITVNDAPPTELASQLQSS